jgi:hypothetical protein
MTGALEALMKRALFALAAALLLAPGSAFAATIELREIAFNVGGTVYDSLGPPVSDPGAPGLDDSGFNYTTGLGTLSFTVTGAGTSTLLGFVDFDIYDGNTDTFFDDTATPLVSAVTGLSWEIDEPGYVFGDIFTNLTNGTLDNQAYNGVAQPNGEDVSMALGWTFSLLAGQTAVVSFVTSLTDPGAAGFAARLGQTSPSGDTIYFSTNLRIDGDGDPGPAPIPEPGTLALFGAGAIIGAYKLRRRVARQ